MPRIPPATACELICETSERILDNALTCLRHTSYPELWKISCEFCEGVLTLQGVVGSYFLKQLAHTAVIAVKGVNAIVNGLEVQYPADKISNRNR